MLTDVLKMSRMADKMLLCMPDLQRAEAKLILPPGFTSIKNNKPLRKCAKPRDAIDRERIYGGQALRFGETHESRRPGVGQLMLRRHQTD